MKKRSFVGALVCSLCLAMTNPLPAMADSQKVVTLGADLNQEQKDRMLKYFNVDTNVTQVLYITNADEREHLSSFVPLEQIGTRTVSCAYVKPTMSGGIRVRTANLDWVTSNMIATTLSTSGVVNCEVVAASPFVVSGTGALTGIMMAYESASGETLDATKKELATQELVVTGKLAEDVGRNDATTIINEAKMEIIQGNVQEAEQIQNIVVNIIQQNNYQVSDNQLSEITSLLEEIAQQQYDYEEMKETLERVDKNVSGNTQDETFPEDEDDQEIPDENLEEPQEEPEDDILESLDESALGEDVITDSTEEPAVDDELDNSQDEEWDEFDWTEGGELEQVPQETPEETIPEIPNENVEIPNENVETPNENLEIPNENVETPDVNVENPDVIPENPEEYVENPQETQPSQEEDQNLEEVPGEDAVQGEDLSPDSLDETKRALYDKAEQFCKAVYQGDAAALDALVAAGDMDSLEMAPLDPDAGVKLTDKVLKVYLQILSQDTDSYVPQDGDLYLMPEMNLLDKDLTAVFGVDALEGEVQGEDFLAAVAQEQKDALYTETMKFFGTMYGEELE